MYLFAFATPAEFVSLFPEHANFANENTSDKLIKLSDNRGYACILGLGILNFATNLTYLLSSVKQQKIEKLQQYKKSVIYEYVTGKREVST